MYVAIVGGVGAEGETLQETWENLRNTTDVEDWEFENISFYQVTKPLNVKRTIIEVPVIKVSEVKTPSRK